MSPAAPRAGGAWEHGAQPAALAARAARASFPPRALQDGQNGPGVAVIELSREEGAAPPEPTLRTLGLPQPDFHSVILDLSPVNFVDTVSIKILKNVSVQGRRRLAASPRASLGTAGWPDGCCLSPCLAATVSAIRRFSGISTT